VRVAGRHVAAVAGSIGVPVRLEAVVVGNKFRVCACRRQGWYYDGKEAKNNQRSNGGGPYLRLVLYSCRTFLFIGNGYIHFVRVNVRVDDLQDLLPLLSGY
jgi:hypothetical protein